MFLSMPPLRNRWQKEIFQSRSPFVLAQRIGLASTLELVSRLATRACPAQRRVPVFTLGWLWFRSQLFVNMSALKAHTNEHILSQFFAAASESFPCPSWTLAHLTFVAVLFCCCLQILHSKLSMLIFSWPPSLSFLSGPRNRALAFGVVSVL